MSRQIHAPKIALMTHGNSTGVFSRDKVADAVHGTKEFANTDQELDILRVRKTAIDMFVPPL